MSRSHVVLDNFGQTGTYYPRLQVNKRGEIVLATKKEDTLTTGILVSKTPESTSTLPIGQVLQDWEVVGPLVDYNGKIDVRFENKWVH